MIKLQRKPNLSWVLMKMKQDFENLIIINRYINLINPCGSFKFKYEKHLI